MSDKSQNSRIEHTYYVGSNVTPGDTIRYGSWEDSESAASRCSECRGSGTARDARYCDVRCDVCGGSGKVRPLPLTVIDCCTGSDYSGSLVEHSNYRVLQKQFPWLVEIHGNYGTFGLAYLGKRENQSDELIEAIDALSYYPIADDSDHSDLEYERVCEAWGESYGGRDDFKRALVKFFDACDEEYEHDTEALSDAAVDDLWYDCTERFRGGEGHINEQGYSIYFPIDKIMRDITSDRTGLDTIHWQGERPTIREQLSALAIQTRVAEVAS